MAIAKVQEMFNTRPPSMEYFEKPRLQATLTVTRVHVSLAGMELGFPPSCTTERIAPTHHFFFTTPFTKIYTTSRRPCQPEKTFVTMSRPCCFPFVVQTSDHPQGPR